MKTSQPRKALSIAIAASALAALAAASPARAVDQSAWLQEQLAISDGGGSYGPSVQGKQQAGGYQAGAQSVWLQQQLAISDGSPPVVGGDDKQVYAATRPSDAVANRQFAFVEHGLHQSDGCNE